MARTKLARNSRSFGLNWALREARRHRGRTALTMLLIGFPLLIATFLAVLIPSTVGSTEEYLDGQLGPQAECRVAHEISEPASTAEITEAQQQVHQVLGTGSQAHGYLLVDDVRVTDRVGGIYSFMQVDFSDEVLAEWLPLREGTTPAQPGEVVIGAGVARNTGQGLGEQLELQLGADVYPLTITGIVEHSLTSNERNGAVAVSSDSMPPALAAALADEQLQYIQLVVTDRPTTVEDLVDLETSLGQPTCRTVLMSFAGSDGLVDSSTMTILSALGAVVVVEIILLVGPAFLIGARQNIRQLALIAANGGTPRTLRRLTLLRNGVLGFIAGLVGVGAGLLAAVGTYYYTELNGRWIFFAFRVNWWIMAAFVLLGVLVSVVASWLPAREAGRLQVVQALRGQRSQARARRSIWLLGLVMVIAGIGLGLYGTMSQSSLLMVLGILGVLLGLVASSGMIIQLLGHLARFAGFSLRFALRDAARNRTRTAGAVAAIMAASAALVAWIAYDNSATVRNEQLLRLPAAVGYASITYDHSVDEAAAITAQEQTARFEELAPRFTADLSRYLENVELVPIHEVVVDPERTVSTYFHEDVQHAQDMIYFATPPQNECQGGGWDWPELEANEELFRADPRCANIFAGSSIDYYMTSTAGAGSGILVDDGALFSRLNSRYGSEQIADVLAAGKSAVTNIFFLNDQQELTLHLITGNTSADVYEYQLPAEYAAGYNGAHVPGGVLHPADVAQLGWSQVITGYLVVNSGPVGELDPSAVEALNGRWADEGLEFQVEVFKELQSTSPAALAYLTGALILLVLGVSSISVSLALTDARADLATLGAVGARPQVRRRIAAAYALVIAGTGLLLGGVGGIVGAAVFVSAQKHQYSVANESWQLVISWPHLALLVLGVPAVVTVLTWLVGGRKLPAVRRLD